MKKLWKKRKLWLILFAAIIIGIVLYFVFRFPRIEIPEFREEIPEEFKGDKISPISSIYRYDWQKREYFSDKEGTWQSSDFLRYIYDLDEESGLNTCYYFVYNNITKQMSGGSGRRCNSNLTVRVGPEGVCSSQGEKACSLYVFATDRIGNGTMNGSEETAPPRFGTATYHIDWEKPNVGETSPITAKEGISQTYYATVSDNIELNYCWLYVDGENVKSMEIKPYPCQNGQECTAFAEYTLTGENHSVWVRCADHYNSEDGNYLNISSGSPVQINVSLNHSPEISSCRVTPTQGTIETEFQFKVEVFDPDGDILIYNWDFGDEESSTESNPSHKYKEGGTYQPKVQVFDEKGAKDNCSTAWVIVSE